MKVLRGKFQILMKLREIVRILFFYTLMVIVWGAWVRISHSGDGCGESWPFCKGELIPLAEKAGKTWVEYTHRLMSGLYGIFVAMVWLKILRTYPKGHPVRKPATAVFFFMITEALLGAKLVLKGFVAANLSADRTFFMSLHQLNSMLLTGSVVLLWLSLKEGQTKFSLWKPNHPWAPLVLLLVAITGAWASLAATLFPTENLWEGLMKDFSSDSHHLLRMRMFHPLTALIGGGSLALYLWLKGNEKNSSTMTKLSVFFVGALIFGILTLVSLSPIWMKLVHLTVAHLLWAALLLWAWDSEKTKS